MKDEIVLYHLSLPNFIIVWTHQLSVLLSAISSELM